MSARKLEALVAACLSTESHRPALQKPHTMELDGRAMTVATDGHRMLLLDGDHGYGVSEGFPPLEHIEKVVNMAPKGDGAVVELDALRRFLGLHLPGDPTPCDACDGKGRWECSECDGEGYRECSCFECGDEHEVKCKHCDGKGEKVCPSCSGGELDKRTPVFIGDRLFDAKLLAPVARHMPGDSVRIVLGTDRRLASLFVGDGFRVLLMPLRDAGLTSTPPRFALVPAASPSPLAQTSRLDNA